MKLVVVVVCVALAKCALGNPPKPKLRERIAPSARNGKVERCMTAPSGRFYPFGNCPSVGDTLMKPTDDGYEVLNLPKSLPIKIFSKTFNKVWVNNNGMLSFDGGISTYTPRKFPKNWTPNVIMAPYWADVDTRKGGEVYYRMRTTGPDVAQAQKDIRFALPWMDFTARLVIVATWYDVPYYGSKSDKRNTFQCVVISDGPNTFAFYKYTQLTWTTGTASGGNRYTGLGGTEAEVGFDGGDTVNYYTVSYSFTKDVLQMTNKNNLGDISWNGNWFNEFNFVGHLAPLMPCLQTRKCCVQRGNAYLTLEKCLRYDQWDYLNHATVNKPDQPCPPGTQFNTDPTMCVCDHADSFCNT